MRDGVRSERPDDLATEEPMEIRVEGPGSAPVSVAVTMRTPGSDFELAAGFLFTEGLIEGREDLRRVSYCEDLPADEQHYNVVTVSLTRAFDPDVLPPELLRELLVRHLREGDARAGRGAVRSPSPRGPWSRPRPSRTFLQGLRKAQKVFDRTGGLHAAGLFAPDGTLLTLREDIGRHNAVDKVVGEAVLAGDLPLAGRVLQVSGRLSFEIVQKAARAGIPLVSAVSAPSSLAVETAEHLGITLVGFVRDGRFNVYTNPDRVAT